MKIIDFQRFLLEGESRYNGIMQKPKLSKQENKSSATKVLMNFLKYRSSITNMELHSDKNCYTKSSCSMM